MQKETFESKEARFTDVEGAAKGLAAIADQFDSDETHVLIYDENEQPRGMMIYIRNDPEKIKLLQKLLDKWVEYEQRMLTIET